MTNHRFRIEKDSMGPVKVPADALYKAQTQRAVDNFPVSGLRFSRAMIEALGLIKGAAAAVNRRTGLMDAGTAKAIEKAAAEVAKGKHDAHFPLDIFQTGSGTSSNMNANEVIASLASKYGRSKVHPNDHVNMGQSSNDVIPTAIHVAAALRTTTTLIPALNHLARTIDAKGKPLDRIVKTGRTHLMDAMPVRMSQELSGWSAQIKSGVARLKSVMPRIAELALGGTAVGTGINAPAGFGANVAAELKKRTGFPFKTAANYFEKLSASDAAVELSGQLKTVAVSMMKIANDLRWMNSGPKAGLGEIVLPALQPGSSIMPGKINPVIPESTAMVCAQVIGNDIAVTIGGQAGNFQLNVMLPVIAHNLLQSIEILANSARLLADRAIKGFKPNAEHVGELVERNPILVTALNPIAGYELGAKIAKRAYQEGRKVKEVALEMSNIDAKRLDRVLDPRGLTTGGIKK